MLLSRLKQILREQANSLVNQPQIQLTSGTQASGARYLQVKYMPPDVG